MYLDVFGSSTKCGHDVFAERTGLLLFGWVNSICWWCDLQQICCDGFVTEFHSSFDLAVYRSISWNLWRVWMFLASLVNLIWMLDCWFMGQNQFFHFLWHPQLTSQGREGSTSDEITKDFMASFVLVCGKRSIRNWKGFCDQCVACGLICEFRSLVCRFVVLGLWEIPRYERKEVYIFQTTQDFLALKQLSAKKCWFKIMLWNRDWYELNKCLTLCTMLDIDWLWWFVSFCFEVFVWLV